MDIIHLLSPWETLIFKGNNMAQSVDRKGAGKFPGFGWMDLAPFDCQVVNDFNSLFWPPNIHALKSVVYTSFIVKLGHCVKSQE